LPAPIMVIFARRIAPVPHVFQLERLSQSRKAKVSRPASSHARPATAVQTLLMLVNREARRSRARFRG
jgi:hypothetical protein